MSARVIATLVVMFGGALSGAAGAHADDMVVRDENGIPWSWADEEACLRDGPDTHLDNASDDDFLKYWYCEQHEDGLWYLHNTDSPTDRVGAP
ncbi:hypothetical protein MKOR_23850 [Mycolicibacillus koreensis]|nr:hypothetical protein MKOR_23850 [Mycolicibacillus koreensis]